MRMEGLKPAPKGASIPSMGASRMDESRRVGKGAPIPWLGAPNDLARRAHAGCHTVSRGHVGTAQAIKAL